MTEKEDPRKLMEDGWKAREKLDFEEAEKLLNKAMEIFEINEDWFNVTECLNHLAYTEKLKAVHHNFKGMEYARKADSVAHEHSSKRVLILRALMSLANSAGLFEQALKWGNECLKEFNKPMPRADVLSHIATFLLRTGKTEEAEKTINEAESLIEEHFEEENEPHRSIWKSKIYMAKGLVLYNKNDLENSKKYFEKAMDIANELDLKTRQVEVSEFLKLFD